VPPGDLGVGGIAPFDLRKASQRVAEMRQIEGTRGVVVREAASLLARRRLLDYRERRIRELADIGSAPRRGCGRRRSYGQKGQHHGEKPHAHLISPHIHNPHHVGLAIDGLASL